MRPTRKVALCPALDIASQGTTIESARENLIEAVELFFETADDTDVLRRVPSNLAEQAGS